MISMITKWISGKPYQLDAVIAEVAVSETAQGLETAANGTGLRFTRALAEDDIVYGLGETTRGINKRGNRIISYNVDNPHHLPDTVSLYGSHNFVVVSGAEHWGFFFDTPARVIFDIDVNGSGLLQVLCDSNDLTVYSISGDSAGDVTHQFLEIIGRSYIPPLWAFGYGQSRWGYKTKRDFRSVADGYDKAGIPLDYICMDIDYMDRFIDFTFHPKRFPDFSAFRQEMMDRGIRLVPIVDAGVKVEPGNPVYEEGVAKNFFCKNKEGGDFQAAVWPGMTHFTDFFQPEAREWFGSKYKFYTDQGVEGFWNDMNEPAIFHSEYTSKTQKKDFIPGGDDAYQPGVNLLDYTNFYHNIDGRKVLHHDVHNAYGYLMTRSAGEQLEKLMEHRYLLFSRSSYIGAHRYGGIWTGDNTASWENLRMAVCQMPSLNMCGFLYIGTDIGGFGGNSNRELLLRWLAFGVFTPLMRNHACMGTRKQECYRFRDTEDFRAVISLRYRLLPYLYSEYMKAATRQEMYFRPLGFDFPDDKDARKVEDQLMVGDSIMIAPLMEKGKKERSVYLPEDMTQVTYDGKAFRVTPMKRGWILVHAELNEVVFFIRKGTCIPVAKDAQRVEQVDLANVSLIGDGSHYEQYLDDGQTKDYGENHIRIL